MAVISGRIWVVNAASCYLFREWAEWPIEGPRARSGAASMARFARARRRSSTYRGTSTTKDDRGVSCLEPHLLHASHGAREPSVKPVMEVWFKIGYVVRADRAPPAHSLTNARAVRDQLARRS